MYHTYMNSIFYLQIRQRFQFHFYGFLMETFILVSIDFA